MRRSKQDDDFHIERHRRTPRSRPPPSSLPANRECEIINDPELLDLAKSFGKNSNEYKRRHMAVKKLHWTGFLNEFHRENLQPVLPNKLDYTPECATPLSIETFGDLTTTEARASVARRYVTTWAIITDACASSAYSIRTKPLVLEALITMCRIERRDSAVYYPGEAPRQSDGDGCHICGKHVQRYVEALVWRYKYSFREV
jgi:hypothetical protein